MNIKIVIQFVLQYIDLILFIIFQTITYYTTKSVLKRHPILFSGNTQTQTYIINYCLMVAIGLTIIGTLPFSLLYNLHKFFPFIKFNLKPSHFFVVSTLVYLSVFILMIYIYILNFHWIKALFITNSYEIEQKTDEENDYNDEIESDENDSPSISSSQKKEFNLIVQKSIMLETMNTIIIALYFLISCK